MEWINVYNKLPLKFGDYLIMETTGEMDVATFYPDASEEWGMWQSKGHKKGGDVTHWMSLPEPPK